MSTLKQMFHDHPAKVGESYLEHMVFAFGFSSRLLKAGFGAFIHGLVPCLHETTASAEVLKLADEIRCRRALMNAASGAAPAAARQIRA